MFIHSSGLFILFHQDVGARIFHETELCDRIFGVSKQTVVVFSTPFGMHRTTLNDDKKECIINGEQVVLLCKPNTDEIHINVFIRYIQQNEYFAFRMYRPLKHKSSDEIIDYGELRSKRSSVRTIDRGNYYVII